MHSLRAKVNLGIILPLVLILGVFMVVQFNHQRNEMLNNLALLASQTSLTIENSLQKAMLTHNREELQQILDSIGQSKMLQAVYILDTTGKVVFSPDGKGVNTQLDNRSATCQPCHRLNSAKRPGSVVVTLPGGERIFRSMNPIHNQQECMKCHDPRQRLNGVLLTDISMAPLEESLTRDMWFNLLLCAAAILVSVIVVNLVFDRLVLHRLETLSKAITSLGLGQLLGLLPENQPDEIGKVSLAFNEMARQVETRDIENRQLSEVLHRQSSERGELLKRLITIQEDERKRVAREIHDELGQALAGLALQTEATLKFLSTKPDRAVQVLNQTQALIDETSERMYNMIFALRPSVLDDLGLVAAIRAHANRFLANCETSFDLDDQQLTGRLPPELETLFYRIFQEALSNIIRHAHAQSVWVILAMEDRLFRGEIRDDGQGFDLQSIRSDHNNPQGLGLFGMQERVMQYNGQLEIYSEPGIGTTIRVIVPIQEAGYG